MQSSDRMDDGTEVRLAVTIDRRDGSAVFDFEGTGPQVYGNTNAPPAVTYSAAIYALRCLVRRDIPLNGGCLAPVTIKVRCFAAQPCQCVVSWLSAAPWIMQGAACSGMRLWCDLAWCGVYSRLYLHDPSLQFCTPSILKLGSQPPLA